jgi:hypothetical protein
MRVGHAARQIGRTLGKLIGKREPYYEPDAGRLAEHLSGIAGSSLAWCSGCGDVLAPVVLGYGEQTEVVAVGCLNCGVGLSVRVGVIVGDDDAKDQNIHSKRAAR